LDTEAQLERLQKDLRPEHPTVVKLRKQQEVNESLTKKSRRGDSEKMAFLPLSPAVASVSKVISMPPVNNVAVQLVTLQTQREGFDETIRILGDSGTAITLPIRRNSLINSYSKLV
jgi:hypothetical protein